MIMSNTVFSLSVIGLLGLGVVLTKGTQWCKYRLLYLKRVLWNAFGRCHKCGSALNYTPKGRGICTNIDCRDKKF